MIIKNAIIYGEDFEPRREDIRIEDGKIAEIGKLDGDGLDCTGMRVLPGFIDIHIHGCNLADTTDGKEDSVLVMSRWLAGKGITSFCPTTMTLPITELQKSFKYAADAMGHEPGAYIHGINMEGPFISPAKKGAQAEEYIIAPNYDTFARLNAVCPVKLVDVAPEMPGALEFAERASKVCTVSAAHTTATY